MPIKPRLARTGEIPAPRPMENNPLIAPQYVAPIHNSLPEGLGSIPGKTPSERVVLETDGIVSGRGVIP